MNNIVKKALQYVENAGETGAKVSDFIEDHDPIGVLLLHWDLAGLVREDKNTRRLWLTEAGRIELEAYNK